MTEIVVGPLLRYVSETQATIFVETSGPCEVEILGRREPTFRVAEHHYALVRIEGLEPASVTEYEVALDGKTRWPDPSLDLPPSAIATIDVNAPLDICFGSCRVALPLERPFTKTKDADDIGHQIDALWVLAAQMIRSARELWPSQLFLLGDQVYVDEGSPHTRERIRERRGTDTEPGDEVTDFEEYTWLYRESWREPLIRWLLSTVSSSMLWDDHDMSDDWNISRSWLQEMRGRSWWHRRAVGCIASYWIYQHLGNLSPDELDDNELYAEMRGNQRADEPLFEWGREISSTGSGTRWSFYRDFGKTRAIFVDSRAGRVLEEDRRAIVDDEQWTWIVDHARGDFDHLLIATTVPFLLSPGFHHLEAWNERMCDGAFGSVLGRASEKLRRAVDFDHWGAFGESFADMRDLLSKVAAGTYGQAPASTVVLSGDVHHAYVCEAGFEPDGLTRTPVYQAVCSPYRNPLDRKERAVVRAGFTKPFTAVAAALGRLAGAPPPRMGWRLLDGPYFDNQVATLTLDGRTATIAVDKTTPGAEGAGAFERTFIRTLV